MKIELGKVYKDKWGDLRIPIVHYAGDVHYISCSSNTGVWIYNPYKNIVKESNFKTWELQEDSVFELDNQQVQEAFAIIMNLQLDWTILIKKSADSLIDIGVGLFNKGRID